jgi:hypothetical protein
MSTWAEKERSIRALERNGKVDPNELIAAARAANHPCHECFTWDVSQAAAERWRDQARELIRRVTFEIRVDEQIERVVNYVPNESDEHLFQSLPKIRSGKTAAAIMAVELRMLYGVCRRVYGIALAKQAMLGRSGVASLAHVRDTVAELLAQFEAEG